LLISNLPTAWRRTHLTTSATRDELLAFMKKKALTESDLVVLEEDGVDVSLQEAMDGILTDELGDGHGTVLSLWGLGLSAWSLSVRSCLQCCVTSSVWWQSSVHGHCRFDLASRVIVFHACCWLEARQVCDLTACLPWCDGRVHGGWQGSWLEFLV
jgi:hypothetical protein